MGKCNSKHSELKNNKTGTFDVIVIGGGATGLGVAVEAISRGYSTLLLEAADFGSGASSKDTKLVHGGIRYLANFDFGLVHEGLTERYYFLKNAPHIAHTQGYLVPFYSWWDKIKYFSGIKLYDFLAGEKILKKSKFINTKETLRLAPQLQPKGLKGSAIYYDGAFDDTRMLISLLKTFINLGGIAHNYHTVTKFIRKEGSQIGGVVTLNDLDGSVKFFHGKVVINATGTMTDQLLDIDDSSIKHHTLTVAQGSHLVFDTAIFKSVDTLVIPKTIDNRILFVLPWHSRIIVGTTDIIVNKPTLEPIAQKTEIDFILETLQQYVTTTVTRNDIKSIFSGQRPLVNAGHATKSAKLSRKHKILLSKNGLVTIIGGKWTIYRKMGEDTIDFIIKKCRLDAKKPSSTKTMHLFDYTTEKIAYPLSVYGSEYAKILAIQKETGNYTKLHPDLPYYTAEVIYHVRYEMAVTVADVLARRTHCLFIDAKIAYSLAAKVAKIMAHEMEKPTSWEREQIAAFQDLAQSYIWS